MTNKELCVGDFVMLSEDTRWSTSDVMNPLNTIGEVIGDSSEDGWVRVRWEDDPYWNAYRGTDSDLILQKPEQAEEATTDD